MEFELIDRDSGNGIVSNSLLDEIQIIDYSSYKYNFDNISFAKFRFSLREIVTLKRMFPDNRFLIKYVSGSLSWAIKNKLLFLKYRALFYMHRIIGKNFFLENEETLIEYKDRRNFIAMTSFFESYFGKIHVMISKHVLEDKEKIKNVVGGTHGDFCGVRCYIHNEDYNGYFIFDGNKSFDPRTITP